MSTCSCIMIHSKQHFWHVTARNTKHKLTSSYINTYKCSYLWNGRCSDVNEIHTRVCSSTCTMIYILYLGHVLDVLVVIVWQFTLGDWIKLSHTMTMDLNRGCSKVKYTSSLKRGMKDMNASHRTHVLKWTTYHQKDLWFCLTPVILWSLKYLESAHIRTITCSH